MKKPYRFGMAQIRHDYFVPHISPEKKARLPQCGARSSWESRIAAIPSRTGFLPEGYRSHDLREIAEQTRRIS